MTIDWWTLALQTLNFLVLVWLLAHFLFRPVSRIIAERQAAAHTALDEARAAKGEAKAAREAAKAETDAIVAKHTALIAQAQADADTEKTHLLEAARAEVDKLRAAGKAELERMRAAQQHELAQEAAALSADIAERLLARLPDAARIDGFIDGLADAVAKLPDATRAGVGAQGPIDVRAARPLSAPEQARLTQALSDALTRPVETHIETDPTLIAGLELDAPHAIVSNHFRADLDRIKAELTGHD